MEFKDVYCPRCDGMDVYECECRVCGDRGLESCVSDRGDVGGVATKVG